LAALRLASLLGAAYIDIELKIAGPFFSAGPIPEATRVIVSSHNYEATPGDAELAALMERCAATGADIIKVATTATDVSDAWRVLRALQRTKHPTIALAMGERGQITRLLAPKYGGFLTFGALSPERQSAPGQPTLAELVGKFGLKRQGPGTKVYGIVGKPVGHR
jgi:3-dehydroquinate dehydratase / shikimate dehydrogenase